MADSLRKTTYIKRLRGFTKFEFRTQIRFHKLSHPFFCHASHEITGQQPNQGNGLIDWQLLVGWGTDSSNTKVLDFTTVPYTIIVRLTVI